MGKDGAYASGSYQTGIGGVKGQMGGDPAAIVAALKDDTHSLADKLSDQDFADLALFLGKGQVAMDNYIDRSSKAPKGDAASGQGYFETLCANCHGVEGTKIKDMKPLGKLMSNPWEIFHKVLYGQPNEEMPALYALDHQIAVDILAHLITLPTER